MISKYKVRIKLYFYIIKKIRQLNLNTFTYLNETESSKKRLTSYYY